MTECERLIKSGLFMEDFFKEEIRCDFLVTTERKKLWAILKMKSKSSFPPCSSNVEFS